jgi:two-component system, chemotaxis family, response regulator Rcp1
MEEKKFEVLLVEDNPGDVRLIVETLKEGRLEYNLNIVHDGEEAVKYLFKQELYAGSATPDIVLLDLKLPKKGGLEVLEAVKNSRELHDLPVVVLTSSGSEIDMEKARELDVNYYVVKPIDYDRFIVAVRSIEDYMLTIVKQRGD